VTHRDDERGKKHTPKAVAVPMRAPAPTLLVDDALELAAQMDEGTFGGALELAEAAEPEPPSIRGAIVNPPPASDPPPSEPDFEFDLIPERSSDAALKESINSFPTPVPAAPVPMPREADASERSLATRAGNQERSRVTQPAPPSSTREPPVAKPAALPREVELKRAMSELFALGDFTGALELAEEILRSNPADENALRKSKACRETLLRMYYARLGPLDRVPIISVPQEQLRWMSIDQRAGFVLHHIDGMSSLDMIIDASGMPTLDVLRILTELVTQRVITIG
jgi:hypothetical protein